MTDYGTDISTYAATRDGPDLDARLGTISGAAVVVQAIARRLTTPRGFFDDDPDYGLDVRGWLGGSFTQEYASSLRFLVESECEKDDRVAGAQANVSLLNSRLSIAITLTLESGETARFTLSVGEIAADITLLQR